MVNRRPAELQRSLLRQRLRDRHCEGLRNPSFNLAAIARNTERRFVKAMMTM